MCCVWINTDRQRQKQNNYIIIQLVNYCTIQNSIQSSYECFTFDNVCLKAKRVTRKTTTITELIR